MKLYNFKKMILVVVVGMTLLTSFKAFSSEQSKDTQEGLIPQMLGQVKQGGFVLTDSASNNTVLEISSTKLTTGPKVLLTFRFGA